MDGTTLMVGISGDSGGGTDLGGIAIDEAGRPRWARGAQRRIRPSARCQAQSRAVVMRMDDLAPAAGSVDEAAAAAVVQPQPAGSGLRFTSNVVGSLFIVTDIICFVLAAPITLAAYSLVRGSRLEVSVHITAFILMLGSFLLIRSSRQAYRRSLLDLSDTSDTTFDAVISSLIASALIWQAGLVEHYSRGITLLFLLTVVLCLSVSRPILHRFITGLAERGQIEQRIAFYGADPDSVSLTRQLLASLKFPHLRFVGIADDRARVTN